MVADLHDVGAEPAAVAGDEVVLAGFLNVPGEEPARPSVLGEEDDGGLVRVGVGRQLRRRPQHP